MNKSDVKQALGATTKVAQAVASPGSLIADKLMPTPEQPPEELIDVAIEPDEKKEFTSNMEELKDKNKFPNRMNQKGFINNGSSMYIKEDGQISLAASRYAQYKIANNGTTNETSFESKCTTNRRTIQTDEMVLNEHKLNPNFYEYTNFKKVDLPSRSGVYIGNLTVEGSVLVKAWDMHLKRYMLIRRPYRGPLFHNLLNVPSINKGLGIDDPMAIHEDILAFSDRGYQVNSPLTDKNTLIGKMGFNRGGEYGEASAGGGMGPSVGDIASTGEGNMNPAIIFDFLKKMGYTDAAAAGIMGNFFQESAHFNTRSKSYDGMGAIGIAQWQGGRRANLEKLAKEKGMSPYDGALQLMYFEQEIRGPERASRPEVLNQCPTPEEAARKFHDLFERSGVPQMDNRKKYARQFYNQFAGKK